MEIKRKKVGNLYDGVLKINPSPRDYNWFTVKLKNRRISVGRGKKDSGIDHIWIHFRRLGTGNEPKIIDTSFTIPPEAAKALTDILLLHDCHNIRIPPKKES